MIYELPVALRKAPTGQAEEQQRVPGHDRLARRLGAEKAPLALMLVPAHCHSLLRHVDGNDAGQLPAAGAASAKGSHLVDIARVEVGQLAGETRALLRAVQKTNDHWRRFVDLDRGVYHLDQAGRARRGRAGRVRRRGRAGQSRAQRLGAWRLGARCGAWLWQDMSCRIDCQLNTHVRAGQLPSRGQLRAQLAAKGEFWQGDEALLQGRIIQLRLCRPSGQQRHLMQTAGSCVQSANPAALRSPLTRAAYLRSWRLVVTGSGDSSKLSKSGSCMSFAFCECGCDSPCAPVALQKKSTAVARRTLKKKFANAVAKASWSRLLATNGARFSGV